MRAAALNSASVVGYIDTQRGLMARAALEAALASAGPAPAVSEWPL